MPGHVLHFAMHALSQPVEQVGFIFIQFNAGDAKLLEAQFDSPLPDLIGKLPVVFCRGRIQFMTPR